jgi:hypothetical protein
MTDAANSAAASSDVAKSVEDATSAIRDTAKWLVASLAAVGAAFAAGVQISSLGSVTDVRLGVGIAAVVVGISGIAWAITRTVDVLIPERLNLRAISCLEPTDPIRQYIDTNADELLEGRATSVGGPNGFRDQYDRAIQARAQAFDELNPDPASATKKLKAQEEDAQVTYLNAVALKVAATGNYLKLRNSIPSWRSDLLKAALLVAASIAIFGWAANPPKPTAGATDLSGAKLVNADLTKADLGNADLTGADLTNAVLSNAKLDGATLDRVVWKNTTCPDGVNSDRAGGSCTGHLK